MQTPDVTASQAFAWFVTIAGTIFGWFGVDATDAQKLAFAGALLGVASAAHVIADALIRRGRVPLAVARLEAALLHGADNVKAATTGTIVEEGK
jgi:hypothetical protein